MSSLYEYEGPLPDTIGQIQQVTEQQEAVISFFYTGEDNKVKLMEIFDVTKTDPSILVGDHLGVNYSKEHLLSDSNSAPATLTRQTVGHEIFGTLIELGIYWRVWYSIVGK